MDAHHFAMASEWMDNGNINEFIKVHQDANRFELVWSYSRCPTATVADNYFR